MRNLVTSVRGPGGGYRLSRPASEIRVFEVLAAVDETVDALHKGAGASGATSGSRAQSMTNRLWEGLSAHVYVFLHQTRLSDVVGNGLAPVPGGADLLCGGGRRVMVARSQELRRLWRRRAGALPPTLKIGIFNAPPGYFWPKENMGRG